MYSKGVLWRLVSIVNVLFDSMEMLFFDWNVLVNFYLVQTTFGDFYCKMSV